MYRAVVTSSGAAISVLLIGQGRRDLNPRPMALKAIVLPLNYSLFFVPQVPVVHYLTPARGAYGEGDSIFKS